MGRRGILAVMIAVTATVVGLMSRAPADAAVAVVRFSGTVSTTSLSVDTVNTTATHHASSSGSGSVQFAGSAAGTLSFTFASDTYRGHSHGTVSATFGGTVGSRTGSFSGTGHTVGLSPSGGVVTMTVKVTVGTGAFTGAIGSLKVIGGIPSTNGAATYSGTIKIPPPPTTTTAPKTTTTQASVQVDDPDQELVTVTPSGTVASYPAEDGTCFYNSTGGGEASISHDGRYVAFVTDATNIVPGSSGCTSNMYVRDRVGHTTRRLDTNDGFPAISGNGRFVSWMNITAAGSKVMVYDQTTGTTSTVAAIAYTSAAPQVSDDGRFVAFQDGPSIDLVDRTAGTTTIVTDSGDPTNAGAGGSPVMTPDGHYLAFVGWGGLVPSGVTQTVFRYDVTTGARIPVAINAWGNEIQEAVQPSISDDGNLVAFIAYDQSVIPSYTPPAYPAYTGGIFVRNIASGTTGLVDTDGPRMSADRFPLYPSMSGNGHYVTYMCWCQRDESSGMGHGGVYRFDLTNGNTIEIDANAAGLTGNGDTWQFNVQGSTADGSESVYSSFASNFVTGDTNGLSDIFVTGVP